jgi:spore maturation protein CgeB
VEVYEPKNGWSFRNLLREEGESAVRRFRKAYPQLKGNLYDLDGLCLERVLEGADLVIVHEWNDRELVSRLGSHRRERDFLLFFHDTHHRSVTDAGSMASYDLSGYDGVLAYGGKIRDIYLACGWAKRAWVWHEAADVRVFYPRRATGKEGDVVWIGNWGDEERSEEIREFLVEPVKKLKLTAMVYGVRYPEKALRLLEAAGIRYGGWLPNFEVPEVFSRYRITLHIPRRPYAEALPGIPTIRPFEALACGIPLISGPWDDCDGLFSPGEDFLYAANGKEAEELLRGLLAHPQQAEQLAAHGIDCIASRHTCARRVDELLAICRDLGVESGGRLCASKRG